DREPGRRLDTDQDGPLGIGIAEGGRDGPVRAANADAAARGGAHRPGGCERPQQDIVELGRRADGVADAGCRVGHGPRDRCDLTVDLIETDVEIAHGGDDPWLERPPQGSPQRDENAGDTDDTASRNDYRSRDLSLPLRP